MLVGVTEGFGLIMGGGPEGGIGCDIGGVIIGGTSLVINEVSNGDFLARGESCVGECPGVGTTDPVVGGKP